MEDFEKKENQNIDRPQSSIFSGGDTPNEREESEQTVGLTSEATSAEPAENSVEAASAEPDENSVEATSAEPDENSVEATSAEPAENSVEPVSEAQEETVPLPVAEEPKPIYRWNYDESLAAEYAKKQKSGNRGPIIYAIVISVAFLLCFTALVFALLFDFIWVDNNQDQPSGDSVTETVVRVEERVVYVREADSSSGILTTQEIYDKCLPSTVSIIVSDGAQTAGTGSGFFVTDDGYIATANHVVEGMSGIKVIMSNGEMHDATLVGGDEYTDIAVIKIDRYRCPAIAVGKSDSLLVGDDVVAIGTPASTDFAGSMAKGCVSYKNRMLKIYNEAGTAVEKKMRLIQTDALVNPGNSGCPLINDKGEVVGIITMKLNSTYYEGMCFALPSDAAMPIVNAMIKGENYDALRGEISVKPAVLGITGENVKITDGEIYGIKISGFSSNDYDAYSKLQKGDIITEMDGVMVTSITELRLLLDKKLPGESVVIGFYRDGQYAFATVTLGS